MGSRIIALVEDYIKITYNRKNIKDFFSFDNKKHDPKVLNTLKEILGI